MCGIVGCFGPSASEPAIAALSHRGPDAQGTVRVPMPWGAGWLGATRLAIVDRGAVATMPNRYPYLGVTLAYNGELYNWRELREELSDGVPWLTRSDAEVVARAYRRWGIDCLGRLNGMFALALADRRDGSVLLARDRAGEKPLYYARETDGTIRFASEVKALGVELAEAECPEVRCLEFDCLESTPFAGVRALLPGHAAVLRGEGIDPFRWWGPPPDVDDSYTRERAADELAPLVENAIRIRVPDEATGTALVSGGLDSAIIQAVARFPAVYCAVPQDGPDTTEAARIAAPGAEVKVVSFGPRETLDALPSIAYHLDTPATWTAVNQWFLARRMATDGVRVVLSGEGADELFAGYSRYRALWWIDRMRRDPGLRGYGAAMAATLGGDDDAILARTLDRGDPQHALALVRSFAGAGDLVARACRLEWHTTMQVLLRMGDRMAAAYSIENRSPFLDHRIVELAFRLPTHLKVGRQSKAILREVARRLGVDRRIVEDPIKMGFALPWNRWFNVQPTGARGAWDRAHFAAAMQAAWRAAFRLGEMPRQATG